LSLEDGKKRCTNRYLQLRGKKKSLNYPWHEIQQAFLAAHQHSPTRAEPLYAIADHYFLAKEMALSYLFALRASQLSYQMSAVLWVQADVYKWRAKFLVGMAAFDLGELETGARALMDVLEEQPREEAVRQQLEKYRNKLSPQQWEALQHQRTETHSQTQPSRTRTTSNQTSAEHTSSNLLMSVLAFLVSSIVVLTLYLVFGRKLKCCKGSKATGLGIDGDKVV